MYPPTLVYFISLAITIVGVTLYNWELPENDLSKRRQGGEDEW